MSCSVCVFWLVCSGGWGGCDILLVQSRCAILRYTRLSDDEIAECMMKVITAEEVNNSTEQ